MLNANVARVKFCFPCKEKRNFLLRRADEKWIYNDNPKKRQLWRPPSHASTSSAKSNIHEKKTHANYLV